VVTDIFCRSFYTACVIVAVKEKPPGEGILMENFVSEALEKLQSKQYGIPV